MGFVGVGINTLLRMALIHERTSYTASGQMVGLSPKPSTQATPDPTSLRPGCTAADEALVVHGHLQGLANGWGGFGVLRTSKERLEQAARGAKLAGDAELEAKFRAMANRLPEVHTPEQAASASREIEALLPRAWNLGKTCKGSFEEHQAHEQLPMDEVRRLATKVQAGEITKEEAVQKLRAKMAPAAT